VNWLRRRLIVLGVFAVLGGTAWFYGGRPAAPPNQPEGPEVVDEMQRAVKLEQQRLLLLWRHEQQDKVVHDLAAGRCTLLAAAARLRALYKEDSVTDHVLRYSYPAPTEEERVCRWVIDYFRTSQKGEAGTPEVVERLERELREHLERGTLRLPGSE
jgi:hypothetical protein